MALFFPEYFFAGMKSVGRKAGGEKSQVIFKTLRNRETIETTKP